MGSKTLPSACYILSDESSIPFYSTSNGYKNKTFKCYFVFKLLINAITGWFVEFLLLLAPKWTATIYQQGVQLLVAYLDLTPLEYFC